MFTYENLERFESGVACASTSAAMLRMRLGQRVDSYMPTEPPVWDITDVPFERWAARGVTTLLVDVEATLGETGSADLIPGHLEALHGARKAGIPNLALHTNFAIKTDVDRKLLAGWEAQAEADISLTPLHPRERKGGQTMGLKAMEFFGLDPLNDGNQVGVIDDKATAGIVAGSRLGAQHRAWTRPFGEQHPGDRFLRGPLEANLRLRAHLLLNPRIRQETIEIDGQEVKLADIIELRPGMADGADKIVGYGIEDIVLSDEVLATINRPAFWVAVEKMQEASKRLTEQPLEKAREFAYEHGRTTADLLTDSRVLIAAGLVLLHHTNLEQSTKENISKALIALAYATDGADGLMAKGHKDGVTAEGGRKDQLYDKILSNVVDLWVLLPEGSINHLNAYGSMSRDILITQLRKPFAARGIDTKSIGSGKLSTNIKGGAQIFGLLFGKRHPDLNRKIQYAATAAKWASFAHAPYVWIERHERKLHDQRLELEGMEVIEETTPTLHLQA